MSSKVMVIDDMQYHPPHRGGAAQEGRLRRANRGRRLRGDVEINDNRPDIIFVDIMMPLLDGYQTCQLIKNNKKFRKTPVIMLSSKDGLFDRARGRIAGSEEHINKPFTQEELIEVINKYVH